MPGTLFYDEPGKVYLYIDKNKLIHGFQKNSLEKVKILLSEYKGKKTIDIRVYYEVPGTSNEWKPCKKGIYMSVDHLEELLKGLKMAHERLKKKDKTGKAIHPRS